MKKEMWIYIDKPKSTIGKVKDHQKIENNMAPHFMGWNKIFGTSVVKHKNKPDEKIYYFSENPRMFMNSSYKCYTYYRGKYIFYGRAKIVQSNSPKRFNRSTEIRNARKDILEINEEIDELRNRKELIMENVRWALDIEG